MNILKPLAATAIVGLIALTGCGNPATTAAPAAAPTVTVPVPGPTVTATKTASGPTVATTKTVPGPTVTVTAPVPTPETPVYTPPVETPVNPATTYSSCADASSKGASLPLYRGQPGYSSSLDWDDDGVACENWG